MKQFIPFDDEWLEHPETMPGPLVPYQAGVPCRHAMAERSQCTGPTLPFSENWSPVTMPN